MINPAYEYPFETPLEEMAEHVQGYRRPVLLVNESGVLVGRNRLADYKTFHVRLGCSAKKLLPADAAPLFAEMGPGEIRRIQLRSDRFVSAAAARFCGYFLIFCFSAREELARSVLDVNRVVGREALNIISYCEKPENSAAERAMMKRSVAEHLRREMNLGKMLEITTGTGYDTETLFSPFLLCRAVCRAAGESGGEALEIETRLEGTELCVRGVSERYACALAAMTAFAAVHVKSGGLRIIGCEHGNTYRFSVHFTSDLTRQELDALIRGDRCGSTAAKVFLRTDLLYIRCIAEDGLWDFDITGSRSCGECGDSEAREASDRLLRNVFDVTLTLSAPLCADMRTELMRPRAERALLTAVSAQFVQVRSKRIRRQASAEIGASDGRRYV